MKGDMIVFQGGLNFRGTGEEAGNQESLLAQV